MTVGKNKRQECKQKIRFMPWKGRLKGWKSLHY